MVFVGRKSSFSQIEEILKRLLFVNHILEELQPNPPKPVIFAANGLFMVLIISLVVNKCKLIKTMAQNTFEASSSVKPTPTISIIKSGFEDLGK